MHSKNIIAVARIFVTLKSLEPNPTVPRLRLGGISVVGLLAIGQKEEQAAAGVSR
jgi:hypothetical protein